MNGLSAIRNINNSNRPTKATRFQLQGVGDRYGVFDTHTGGFGFKSADASAVSKEVDRANIADLDRVLAVKGNS